MRNKGFTLIELLVVIAVIALLLVILVPVLQKSKNQGKDILCSNNLRQLAFAVSLYTQKNTIYPEGFCGNKFCHSSISTQESLALGISNSSDWKGYWWFCFLADAIEINLTEKDGIFHCPSKNLSDDNLDRNILCGNYGINYSLCKIIMGSTDEFQGKPLKPECVSYPSGKLLLTDAGYALISWKAMAPDSSTYTFENPNRQNSFYLPGATVNKQRYEDGTINEFQQDDAVKGRHSSGKFNTAFADGHVDSKKTPSIVPTFDAAGNVVSNSSWAP